MESVGNGGLGVRSKEDIALDLLKFVAGIDGIWPSYGTFNGIQRGGCSEAGGADQSAAGAV